MRLPAYGKGLLDARRGGQAVLTVGLALAENFARVGTSPHPKLALKPSEWQPHRIDWTCVTGLYVIVFDADGWAFDCDPAKDKFSGLYDLVGELADRQAFVELRWPARTWASRHADLLAWEQRRWDAKGKRFAWPRWWSDARERGMRTAFYRCMSDVALVKGVPLERAAA